LPWWRTRQGTRTAIRSTSSRCSRGTRRSASLQQPGAALAGGAHSPAGQRRGDSLFRRAVLLSLAELPRAGLPALAGPGQGNALCRVRHLAAPGAGLLLARSLLRVLPAEEKRRAGER
jgi:hypothetical protein